MRFLLQLTLVSIVLLLTISAQGSVTEYTNKPSWLVAAGPHTTIGFTGFPDGTEITYQYESQGVTFTNPLTFIQLNASAYPNDGAGLKNNVEIAMKFAQPMTSLAVDYPGSVQFKLYNQNQLIYTSTYFGPTGAGNFAGLISTLSFDSAILLRPTGEGVFIDDLHFGPPIPAPGVVSLLGLAALVRCRRRS